MPRTCFVIMPFSATASCTEDEWTWIFENVFKPSIEGAGLDYECRRSVATRGNIVASILEELDTAYLVLADLTDRNANVFYELGVRHSLRDRTIIVAQKSDDIPFDLQAYARHVYDWKTKEGCHALADRLKQLLADVDTNPERPDNPVSDFLRRTFKHVDVPSTVEVRSEEVGFAQPLAGPAAEGLDAIALARRMAHAGRAESVRTVLRLTRAVLYPLMKDAVDTLNRREAPASIKESQISELAQQYIAVIEPLTQKIEQFALGSIAEGWVPGTEVGLRFAGDWISISERRSDGRTIRLAQGVPALLAWRLLVLSGAEALAEEAFELLGIIVKEPIEVEDQSGRFSSRSLIEREDLFHPEAFLGHANHAIRYIAGLWKSQPQLHGFFGSEEDYHFAVAKFLMLVALAAPPDEGGYPLYPGYRLLPQASRAMSSLCSRIAASQRYLEGIAQSIGETPASFQESWPKRVKLANSAGVGSRHEDGGIRFPEQLGGKVTE